MFNTPFILFLILLSALVISMLFGNTWLLSRKEGFVSFGYTNPNIMNVTISPYSAANTVIYLYDNLYFDGKNGNLIEVDSPYCGNVRVNGSTVNGNISCNDANGSSITQLWVTTSSAATTNIHVNVNTKTPLATVNANSQISQLVYLSNSQNISSPAGYRYQIFYISWGLDTYLHVLGLDPSAPSGTNIKSFYYNNPGSMMRYIDFTSSSYIPAYKQTFNSNADANNSTLYLDTTYSSTQYLYQISKYVKYDISAGLVVVGLPGAYTIYNRGTGAIVPSSTGMVATNLSSFVSWIITDGNNGMVVVMAFAYQTVILIVNSDPNNNYYTMSFCARFTNIGMITAVNDAVNVNNGRVNPLVNDLPCVDELSCKWYYYFKTIGHNPDVLFKNDFIRKTQIVPPVCPRCPNCPNNGVCNSCGGCGGSGTSDASGSILKNAATGAVNLTKQAVGGTVGLAKDVVGGTVGLAEEVVGGTVGLAKEVVGGTVGLAKEVVGGTVGLAKDVVGGVASALPRNNKAVSDSGFGYVPGQGYTPVDNYSAYGASQTKGANYMPITTSFAAFGK
jgi:hypothetical protein